MATVQSSPQSISFEELESLRKVRRGVGATKIPVVHRAHFIERGWVEEKFGGVVLTALGRYMLDLRTREPGLVLVANRWQRRAKELRALADNTTGRHTDGLHQLAAAWETLAAGLLEIERGEASEPLLGDGNDSPHR
jgi:hypothetical protein